MCLAFQESQGWIRLIDFVVLLIILGLVSAASTAPSLWVGTNGGAIQIHSLNIPPTDKRTTEELSCELVKEIQLQHRAPVLAISIVNNKDIPIDYDEKKESGGGGDEEAGETSHRLIVCSEEQIKSFTLPTLKSGRHKLKLTANEGSRIRKVQLGLVPSRNGTDATGFIEDFDPLGL